MTQMTKKNFELIAETIDTAINYKVHTKNGNLNKSEINTFANIILEFCISLANMNKKFNMEKFKDLAGWRTLRDISHSSEWGTI